MHHRSIKTHDPKSIFKKRDDERTQRLAEKLQEAAKRPTVTEQRAAEAGEDANMEEAHQQPEADAGEDQHMDGSADAEPKKISTHGPKASGRAEYKRAKGFKLRKGRATTDFRIRTARRRKDGLFL